GSRLAPTPTKPAICASTSATNDGGKRRCWSRRCSSDGPLRVYAAAHESRWIRAVASASSGVAGRISTRPNLHFAPERLGHNAGPFFLRHLLQTLDFPDRPREDGVRFELLDVAHVLEAARFRPTGRQIVNRRESGPRLRTASAPEHLLSQDPSADDGRAVYAGDAEQDVGSLVKDEIADVPESAERGRERLLLVPEPVAYRAGPSERLEERVERLRRRSRPCGPKAQCGAPEPVHEDVRLDVSREAIYCARLLAFSRRPHASTVLAFAISSSSGGRPGRGLAGALSIQLGLTPHKFSPSLVLLQRARVVLLIARPETG